MRNGSHLKNVNQFTNKFNLYDVAQEIQISHIRQNLGLP